MSENLEKDKTEPDLSPSGFQPITKADLDNSADAEPEAVEEDVIIDEAPAEDAAAESAE